jgi:uncharacterized protein YyaL (SSP411 family)
MYLILPKKHFTAEQKSRQFIYNKVMNRLIHEVSPYLLSHASNPVDWQPWDDIAIQKAKTENKPIFLSIGYSACHWCHVMEHESFSDLETAKIINSYFVPIKVDREERPDIDKVYMDALVAMTGQGGWPLTGFLTPQGHPFYMGTYFPAKPNFGLPGFKGLLQNIISSYEKFKSEINAQSLDFTQKILQTALPVEASQQENIATLNNSIKVILNSHDNDQGGWGKQPKFPHPLVISLLQNDHLQDQKAIQNTLSITLDAMVQGGFYDILRGGFHRYSTDDKWLIPHFEKMLYDNAQLAQIYLFAGQRLHNEKYKSIALSTLNFMANELLSPNEGFWSSLDADSEGEEGKFYVWTKSELETALTPAEFAQLKQDFYIEGHGNFDSRLILRLRPQVMSLPELSNLKKAQDTRVRPKTDEKLLVDWNALAISTFAKASLRLRNDTYQSIAKRVTSFILDNLVKDERLYHSYRSGKLGKKGFLSDYANLINALIDLFLTNYEMKWLDAAFNLCDTMVDLFWDSGQFYDTGKDETPLIVRPQTIDDSVIPSGWAAALLAIQKLNQFRLEEKFSEIIQTSIDRVRPQIQKHPLAYPIWLKVIANQIYAPTSIIMIKSESEPENASLMERAILDHLQPDDLFLSVFPTDSLFEELFILRGKLQIDNRTTIYLCSRQTCSQPIFTIQELELRQNPS